MRRTLPILTSLLAVLATAPATATAQEACGDGQDNDSDGLADEGCFPSGVTGVCAQPLGCTRTGWVGPVTGQLVWREPADLAPAVAYGPGLSFRRTYMSLYDPGYQEPNDTDFRAPMGKGWGHNFMSWIDLDTAPNPDEAVVHTTGGQDILFKKGTPSGGWDYYLVQAGYHFVHLRQNQSSPYQWELKDLTGWIYEYRSAASVGKLTKVTDPVGNILTITYNGDDQVDKVLDATGNRGLEFSYFTTVGDKLLRYVTYRTYSGGTGTDRVTLELVYASSYELTAAKIGTGTRATFRNYTYDSDAKLTKIEDAESTAKTIAEFKYLEATAGKIARVETGGGIVGWNYVNGTTTEVGFHHTGDVGGACDGGDIAAGMTDPEDESTGLCFDAYQTLTIRSTNEDLVDAVSASCASCTSVEDYAWDTGSSGEKMDLLATQKPRDRPSDGSALWTSYLYDANGMVTKVVENDTDSSASTVPTGGRATFYLYGNSSYPGLVTERRRVSALNPTGNCSATTTEDCKRTIYAYTSGGLLSSIQEIGMTETASGTSWYDFTTNYAYDGQGRVTEIKGPRYDASAGIYESTEFTYWSSSGDVFKDYFLKEVKRRKAVSTYLTTLFDAYDHWGNAQLHKPPVADLVCQVYDGARNVATSRRYAMNGQTDCSTGGAADEETQWTYDTALRVTKEQHDRGDCIHYEYDSTGRISKRKDRDDCTPANAGDTMEYTYSADGLLTKVEYKDDGGAVTWRQEYTYRPDRRMDTALNPVASSYSRQWDYENDGLLKKVTGEDGIGRTDWLYDAIGRLDLERRYTASGASDDWDLTPGVQLDLPTKVQDEDSKAIDWKWDDLGRKIKQVTPDAGTNWFKHDPSGNLTEVVLASGTADTVTNAFVYDSLDRMTAENTGDTSCGGEQGAEIQYVYDATPSGCPSGQTCGNLSAHLAYVKLKVACDTSESDDTIDQETFYSYDNRGRVVREFIQDDTTRTALTTYVFNDNNRMTQVVPPSAIKFVVVRGDVDHNSDMDKIERVNRIDDVETTTMVASTTWMPFGPINDYTQQNKKNSHKIIMRPSYNLAYRPTEFLWEEASSGTDLFKIAYTEDLQGRITARDFTGAASGVQDAYYTYDWHDRVTCDSAASGTCPTSGANLKSNMSASPPFTQSSDRKEMKHSDPLVGESTYYYELVNSKDQVDCIREDHSEGCSGSDRIEFSWDTRGNRTADDDTGWTHDDRTYTYDARNNLVTVTGDYLYAASDWNPYTITNVYDHKNHRIFKSFLDTEELKEAQWYFTYDQRDRLVEVKHIPDTGATTTYSIYDFYWIEDRPVTYYQIDYPGTGDPPTPVTTRRFLHADEINRPLEAWSWPSSGDASRVWAINPDLFGWDYIATGSTLYQPLRFPGQHLDGESTAHRPNGASASVARPALHHNRYRAYDPFVGSFLQIDGSLDETWDPYSYAYASPVGTTDPTGNAGRKGPHDDGKNEVIVIWGTAPPDWGWADPEGGGPPGGLYSVVPGGGGPADPSTCSNPLGCDYCDASVCSLDMRAQLDEERDNPRCGYRRCHQRATVYECVQCGEQHALGICTRCKANSNTPSPCGGDYCRNDLVKWCQNHLWPGNACYSGGDSDPGPHSGGDPDPDPGPGRWRP